MADGTSKKKQIVNRACWFDLKEQGHKLHNQRNENRKNTKLF